MASIRKRKGRKKTHYQVEVRLKGRPQQTATFDRLSDARAWALKTEAAIREGRHFPKREERQRTVRDLLDRYIQDVLPRRRRNDKDRLLVARQLRFLEGFLGDLLLQDLTPDRIARVRDAIARGESPSGKPTTPATCNRYLAVLSHVCSTAAREWGWLESNPVQRVMRLREPRGRVRFLSDDERARLLATCRTIWEPRLYPLVLLALATGARQGELLSLRWRHVDLDRSVVIFEETKNGERRAVPVTGEADGLLREMAAERRSLDDFVFEGPSGRPCFPRRAWNAALEQEAIEDFRFHDLRHSTASYLAMSGATLAEIAEVLGHKTLAMVKRYSHLTEAHTRGVLARMTARL